ncbi:MAG: hypothetical protein ABS87_08130 [Sphingomonas sp. SCN 67-18]|uniref:hypothetical protein n=1 Tax=uncultured Sphingomonas sp. TaxID=158754 RepID=UPI00086E0C66|nr:hypothetical protein [Sphingomonas sp. SCN 67-18]ODU21030.1 MAG: hypothetical protein ABS87_08130 [Sphingomonas sp. SCN 67-18]
MSWDNHRLLKSGLALALFAGFAGTALAGSIVVRSSGPSAKSYPPGKALADNARITLRAGDQIVILDGRGTRTVKGPGTFDTASASVASGATATARRILSTQSTAERRGGAVRGTAPATVSTRNPNLWFVDLSQSATVCVADPANVRLWRADASADATATLTAANGRSAPVRLERNVNVVSWPAALLPVTDGAEYSISGLSLSPVKIKVALLGPNPQGIEGTATALIQRGCNTQLDLLIETVAVPDSGTDG